MNEFSDKELSFAKSIWTYHYSFKSEERELKPFLDNDISAYKSGQKSWLMRTRKGLFLSREDLAKKLKITRTTWAHYEKREAKGKITIETLAAAAEAMDCELIYAIRPKNKKLYSDNVWEILFKAVKNHQWLKKCDQRRRGAALGNLILRKMNDPHFKREQGWSQRLN